MWKIPMGFLRKEEDLKVRNVENDESNDDIEGVDREEV